MTRPWRNALIIGLLFEILLMGTAMRVSASALAQIPSLGDAAEFTNSVNLFNFVVAGMTFMLGGSILLNYRAQMRAQAEAAAQRKAQQDQFNIQMKFNIETLSGLLTGINTLAIFKQDLQKHVETAGEATGKIDGAVTKLGTAHETMLRTEAKMRFELGKAEASITTFTQRSIDTVQAYIDGLMKPPPPALAPSPNLGDD